ncbi:hypothetical protein SK128_009086 [Halocaridina rubra]|uniref:Hexosyltransferase n=1 Tax=Halocaridina rubra TaxID=373956 RepID=A0AAN8ZYZ3_HALRR
MEKVISFGVQLSIRCTPQVDIDDDYHLLTYKGLAALSWITRHCGHVPWILHADDDVFIDIFLLHINMREFDVKTVEHFFCNALTSHVLRSGRWAVSHKQYPSHQYPVFCSGRLWILPTRLAPKIVKAAKNEPFLWVDDVFITGILGRKANISVIGDPDGFASESINASDIGRVLAWHSVKDRQRWWDILQR